MYNYIIIIIIHGNVLIGRKLLTRVCFSRPGDSNHSENCQFACHVRGARYREESRVKFHASQCLLPLSDREPTNPTAYIIRPNLLSRSGGPDLNRKSIKFSSTVPTFSSGVMKTRLTAGRRGRPRDVQENV